MSTIAHAWVAEQGQPRAPYVAPEMPTAYSCTDNCPFPTPPLKATQPTPPLPPSVRIEAFRPAHGSLLLPAGLVALAGIGMLALMQRR